MGNWMVARVGFREDVRAVFNTVCLRALITNPVYVPSLAKAAGPLDVIPIFVADAVGMRLRRAMLRNRKLS
jgi:hypothetical protein